MILHIFDRNYKFIGFIDNFISLTWKEQYQNVGALTLFCNDSVKNIKYLQQGYFVWQKGKRTAMIIRYVKPVEGESQIEVRGYTSLWLLSQRTIYPTQTIYNIETGMYNLVKHSFTSSSARKVTDLDYAFAKGFTYVLDTQYTLIDLMEAENALAVESGLGFYMQFDYENKKNIFTVYEGLNRTYGNGVNKPAMFSTEFGNLQNTIIIDDMTIFKNVAIVAGAGEGVARIVIEVGTATGWDRYELPVDARDLQQEYTDDNGNEVSLTLAQYKIILQARGIKKLNEHVHALSFSGEVNTQDFGEKYYLGDIVSCKSDRYNMRIDSRVTEYEEVTENNITKLKLTFGEPAITLLKEVKSWL